LILCVSAVAFKSVSNKSVHSITCLTPPKLKREALAELRYAAAKLLGEIEEPTAIEPLISALKDEYPPVRRAAAKSLTKITEEDFGINHDRWQNWRKQNK